MKRNGVLFFLFLFPFYALWGLTPIPPTCIDGIYYYFDELNKSATVTTNNSSVFGGYQGDIVIPAAIEFEGITYEVLQISGNAFDKNRITSITFYGNTSADLSSCHYLKDIYWHSIIVPSRTISFWGDNMKNVTLHVPSVIVNLIQSDGFKEVVALENNSSDETELVVEIESISYRINTDEKKATIIYGNKLHDGDVVIPSIVNYDNEEYVITSINDYAFAMCEGLNSITLPEGVCSIGNYAFSGCHGLKSISLPTSLRSIGYCSFLGCDNLSSIHISDLAAWCGVTFVHRESNPLSIAHDLFIKDCKVEQLILTSTITYIKKFAFYNCSISSIMIPNSVISLGEECFMSCSNLTSVTIPASVTTIGNHAYAHCSSINSIDILGKVYLEDYSFAYCTGLKSLTILPSMYMGYGVFFDCSSLEYITIANGVSDLGTATFEGCANLTSISIPYGVKRINYNTFTNCEKLSYVSMPNCLTEIGGRAFEGCKSLNFIDIPNSVKTIGCYAFAYCSSLTSITIPDSVNYIGDGAFEWCDILKSIKLPSKLEHICYNTFKDCYSLSSLYIPDSLRTIEYGAFENCGSLESVIIPGTVRNIGSLAFSGCFKLSDVYCYPSTALDINSYNNPFPTSSYWNDDSITLHVPASAINDYSTKPVWKDFDKIVPLPQLSYYIDGELYSVQYPIIGRTITPESEPVKEGYTFSGWSTIPETMPACDVIIVGTFSKNPEEQPYEPDLSQIDNVIYINSAEARVGSELTLSIKMKNNVAIRGFQFDLYLPEGVTAVKAANGRIVASLTADRLPNNDGHSLAVNVLQDGAVRFLCGSQSKSTFTGNDGEIMTIQLSIAEDMNAGVYPMVLRNMKLTESNIDKYYVADGVTAMLTVYDYVTGDINGDDAVDVSDYIGIANHILQLSPEGFNERAADVNDDGVIDVSDYIGVANIILTGSVYGSRQVSRISRHGDME